MDLTTFTTRWFKYDRDKLWLVYTQIVPVIFEPPCIIHVVYRLISRLHRFNYNGCIHFRLLNFRLPKDFPDMCRFRYTNDYLILMQLQINKLCVSMSGLT
jgi:hypothetical protein